MSRRVVSLFVLAAFGLFNWSCLMPRRPMGVQRTVKKDISQVESTNRELRIVNVITKSGDNIAFKPKDPGNFLPDGTAVVGNTDQWFEFDKAEVKIAYKGKARRVDSVETKNGRVYKAISATEEADKIRMLTSAPITIPSSDIQQVWIRKTNVGMTVALAVVTVAAGIALTYVFFDAIGKAFEDAFSGPEWESCPFVYSYNGEEYVLDAEPYGMAVSEGLKRTDWVEMSNLRAVDGKYRVLLANELDETQYTDELKLAVVDHAVGVKIAPDTSGRFHTFGHQVAPSRAVDQKGRDVLKFVAANDRVFWTSRLEEKNPEDVDLRDELVFEFPKPAGAETARLLANAWTTQWGSLSAGRFLRLFGSSLPERYADVDRFGPTYRQFLAWMSSEELYTLKIWVETPSGWKSRGMIYGGAPVVAKDKAYVLDVGDVPGDVLRIKLRPPVNFWMVNSLAVDYGEESPIQATELPAETAVDQAGRDVRTELAATDDSYLESPQSGQRTELVFAAPPARERLERTVFVKASGYYRIHIDARGEPQTELVSRVLGEPGFAVRYSFREYLKWEASLRAQADKAGRTRDKAGRDDREF
jgi:hypothetical protein